MSIRLVISNEPQSGLAAIVARHRALAVLRILIHEALNGSANDGVLSDALDDWALGCTQATLQACLRHLEQSGLLTTFTINGRTVARITCKGNEVAVGKVEADGVRPFSVDCPY